MTIDLTIGGNTTNIAFGNISSFYNYYVGWTTGTAASFAALTDAQVEALATEQHGNPYTGQFGSKQIFFLLYDTDNTPESIVLSSSGIAMEQDIVEDNTCPHADVVIGEKTYKVFGMRFYAPIASDSVTVTF